MFTYVVAHHCWPKVHETPVSILRDGKGPKSIEPRILPLFLRTVLGQGFLKLSPETACDKDLCN